LISDPRALVLSCPASSARTGPLSNRVGRPIDPLSNRADWLIDPLSDYVPPTGFKSGQLVYNPVEQLTNGSKVNNQAVTYIH